LSPAPPLEPGPLTLTILVNYVDDFNESKLISDTLEIEVLPQPEPPIDPNQPGGEGSPPQTEESFFDMLARAFLGLIGLDSVRPTPVLSPDPGEPFGPKGNTEKPGFFKKPGF